MNYQLELRHIRYFLAVAEDLHFRKAAERLYISQPGLSKQIKEMETGLATQLFDRNNRHVALTPSGQFLKEELAKYMQGLQDILHHSKLLHDGLQGDLSLGYVGSAMQEIIPNLLVAHRKQFPTLGFNLKEMDNTDQIHSLLNKEIDVGFVRLERVPRGLKKHAVLKEAFCLVLPSKHPLHQKNFKRMSQLKDESFILFDPKYSPSYYEKVMQIFDGSGFTPIISHKTIHSNSIYKMVEHGFGISIVPKSLQFKHMKGVKFIELDKIPQRTTLTAVWNSDNRNPVINNFIKELKKYKSA